VSARIISPDDKTTKTTSRSQEEPISLETEIRICPDNVQPVTAPWSFESSIDPITTAEFCSNYWNKNPLHISRRCANFYEQLITLAEVERYFSVRDIFTRHLITLPRQGYGIPEPPPASIGELYGCLSNGSSIRIRRMESFMDPAAPVLALLRGMEIALQHPRDSLSCYIV
jgi:hypothetical protein